MQLKSSAKQSAVSDHRKPVKAVDSDLDPVALSVWGEDAAWLGSRINYLALRYNSPTYEWMEQRFGLLRSEIVVLYFLGRNDGMLARDISRLSGHPENTLSRAVQKLCGGGYITRKADPKDRRNRLLYLLPRGRRVVEEARTVFVKRHDTMLATLSRRERDTLMRLLKKIILDSPNWPTDLPVIEPFGVRIEGSL